MDNFAAVFIIVLTWTPAIAMMVFLLWDVSRSDEKRAKGELSYIARETRREEKDARREADRIRGEADRAETEARRKALRA